MLIQTGSSTVGIFINDVEFDTLVIMAFSISNHCWLPWRRNTISTSQTPWAVIWCVRGNGYDILAGHAGWGCLTRRKARGPICQLVSDRYIVARVRHTAKRRVNYRKRPFCTGLPWEPNGCRPCMWLLAVLFTCPVSNLDRGVYCIVLYFYWPKLYVLNVRIQMT